MLGCEHDWFLEDVHGPTGAAAVFLASPLAAYVSGTVLVVDGGQNLAGSCPFGELLDQAMSQSD